MPIKFVIMLSVLTFSNILFAHGMNKPGPNGGFIKMPGTFHTELLEKGEKVHVYLLDINFKDPTTLDSSVKIKYNGAVAIEFNCSKKNNFFVCDKPASGLKDVSEIVVNAVRKNTKANEAVYKVPLKLE